MVARAPHPLETPMKEFTVDHLLDSGTVAVRHVDCRGTCRHRSAEECATQTHFVFPYRGVYLRHVSGELAVADANHVLLFNAGQGYQVSHPVTGGDASLVLSVSESMLRELAPKNLVNGGDVFTFNQQHLRIDARAGAGDDAQTFVADRHDRTAGGRRSFADAGSRAIGPRTTHEQGASYLRRRLVDRVKVLLAEDLSRRWTLGEIAARIHGSPVYLTQVFQQVEGLPLYRYQLRLRLARALDLIAEREDLSTLAQDLGFSSHSHFSAAFRQAYGTTPAAFRAQVR
jgi:AraC family transcriptional regulator